LRDDSAVSERGKTVAAPPVLEDRPMPGAAGALLVIVSGPSGVGKDTVISALRTVPVEPPRHFVVTCTTRPRRQYEVDGIHYHFLDDEEFARRREAGGFLEANLVHGHWYGTPRDEVRAALVNGQDVVLKIDVQGAAVVKQKVPEALLVFLVPPTLEDLFSRLQARATESADELDIRQRNAALELARQSDYDYVVRNETGEVDRTASRIDTIIRSEKATHADQRTRV
jgi:guanylate kinase